MTTVPSSGGPSFDDCYTNLLHNRAPESDLTIREGSGKRSGGCYTNSLHAVRFHFVRRGRSHLLPAARARRSQSDHRKARGLEIVGDGQSNGRPAAVLRRRCDGRAGLRGSSCWHRSERRSTDSGEVQSSGLDARRDRHARESRGRPARSYSGRHPSRTLRRLHVRSHAGLVWVNKVVAILGDVAGYGCGRSSISLNSEAIHEMPRGPVRILRNEFIRDPCAVRGERLRPPERQHTGRRLCRRPGRRSVDQRPAGSGLWSRQHHRQVRQPAARSGSSCCGSGCY